VPDEKKEKVIHTRIPAALEEQIKRLAEGLRVPVSNLVRNMLEDAIDVTRRMRAAVGNGRHDDLADVFGWQALTLNMETACARCERELGAGDDAYMGLTDRPRQDLARVFICQGCLPRKTKSAKKKERE
jgi:hypothetical protein